MPILNSPLDQHGHALVDLFLDIPSARRLALQSAAPQRLHCRGMVDPGATITAIDSQVRQALSLAPFRVRRASVPNTPAPIRVRSYKVDLAILFPSGVVIVLAPKLSVVAMPIAQTGVQVLLGCDVLSKCQFIHNGSAQTFSLAW